MSGPPRGVCPGGASGYSGSTQLVQTRSGNANYRCNADLLFGPGVEETAQFKDVVFNTFEVGPLEPCFIRVTPSGNAQVNRHARD